MYNIVGIWEMTIRILKSPKCWSWNSNTLAIECEELTHWKRPWCWERLKEGEEGDNRRWDGWMASLTQWTWVWVNSRSWRWTGRPGMLHSMGLQSQTQLSNWIELTEMQKHFLTKNLSAIIPHSQIFTEKISVDKGLQM